MSSEFGDVRRGIKRKNILYSSQVWVCRSGFAGLGPEFTRQREDVSRGPYSAVC